MWGERRGRWLSSHWQMAPQRRNVFSSCRRQPSWASSKIPMSSLSMGFLDHDPVRELYYYIGYIHPTQRRVYYTTDNSSNTIIQYVMDPYVAVAQPNCCSSYIHSQYSVALFIADVSSGTDGKWEPKRVPTTHEIEVNTYTVQYNQQH